MFAHTGRADITSDPPYGEFSPLQQVIAQGTQAAYNALEQSGCTENPLLGAPAAFTTAPLKPRNKGLAFQPPLGTCTGGHYDVFSTLAPIVDTANLDALGTTGNVTYALTVLPASASSIGQDLQSTAASEYAAMGESAIRFARLQQERVLDRIDELRNIYYYGDTNAAKGHAATGASPPPADTPPPPHGGGGASADDSGLVSPWGIFADAAYNYGHRGDTTNVGGFEDAYRFSNSDLSIGVDYRFNDTFVAGVLLAHSDGRTNFDGNVSVVNAQLGQNGYSSVAYFLWERGDAYLSGSLGYQWLSHTSTRTVSYTSSNFLVTNLNATASGRTESQAMTAVLDLGYDLRSEGTTLEPYVRAQAQHFEIGAFAEGGDSNASTIDQTIAAQRFNPIDTVLGSKLQQVFTPHFGVFIPYVRGEYHHEFNSHSRTTTAEYTGILDLIPLSSSAAFHIPTDHPDNDYMLVNGGLSAMFPHGIQAYLQYQQIFGLKPYIDHTVTAGGRWEF